MKSRLAPFACVVGPSWPFRGGIADYTTELAVQLSRRDSLALFITPKRQYPKVIFPGKSDRDESARKPLSFAKSLYSYFEPWTWPKVIRELETSRANYVLTPHWSMVSAPFVKYLIEFSSKPVVPIIHNFFGHDFDPQSEKFMNWILKNAAAYFHHNPDYRDLKFFQSRVEKVQCHLLPLSSKNQILDPLLAREKLEIPDAKIALLFFGLIREYKGLNVLLDALELLPQKLPIALLVAGEPWHKKKILKSRLNKISNKIWVKSKLEWISEEETKVWFSACDGVVLPYLRATGSAVATQAVSFHKPIIATRTGCLSHLVEDGLNGFLCEPGSPKELAKRIQLFCDPIVRAKIKPELASSRRLSWDSYLDSLESLAQIALSNHPR